MTPRIGSYDRGCLLTRAAVFGGLNELHAAYSRGQTIALKTKPTGLTVVFLYVLIQGVSGWIAVVVVKVLCHDKVASLKRRDVEVTH